MAYLNGNILLAFVVAMVIIVLLFLFTNSGKSFTQSDQQQTPDTALNTYESSSSVIPVSEEALKTDRGSRETIEETMARLKRDVIVTGAVLGSGNNKSAFFSVEGNPDKEFKIETQLMDGFIITDISASQVTLKRRHGSEMITLLF